ncbi:hypothetical protein MRX96_058713 [Rhipicephalus microplus]
MKMLKKKRQVLRTQVSCITNEAEENLRNEQASNMVVNPELFDINWSKYLRALLSEADGAMAGLEAMAECYADAIDFLNQQLGNPMALIQDHMQELIDLKHVTSV